MQATLTCPRCDGEITIRFLVEDRAVSMAVLEDTTCEPGCDYINDYTDLIALVYRWIEQLPRWNW